MALKLVREIKTQNEGFSDWWKQRVTGLFLIPMIFWIIGNLAFIAGTTYDWAREKQIDVIVSWFATPYNTIIMVFFFPLFFYHAYYGSKVVVEDYVHNDLFKTFVLAGLVFTYGIFAVSGITAVLKLAFVGM